MNEIAKVKKEVKLKQWAEMVQLRNESVTVKYFTIHTFQGHRIEFTIKYEPSLACTKCNNKFQAE